MRESGLEGRIDRSRRHLERLRRRVESEELAGDSPLAEAVEELGHTLEELAVTLEELASTNEELGEAQLAAESHARRYLELFRFAPDAYVVTDDRGVIREINTVAEQNLGRPARYLVGKPLLSLVAEADRDGFLASLAALRERRGRLEDRPIRFGVGAGFDAAVTAVPELWADDLEIRWTLRDVTARRRAEAELRSSEERVRAVLDAALDGILSADGAGAIRSVNPALCRMFGYAAHELVDREVTRLLAAPGRPGHRPSLAVMAGSVRELEGIARDGSRFPIQVSVGRASLDREQTFVVSVRDLSGQRTLESQLRAAAAAAAVAEDRERRRLAADLHDEVSQLLTLAGMKLGMLRGEAGEHGLEKPVREVEELVARAHQRTDSLTFQLSPPILHDVGLAAAAEWLAEEMEGSYGLRVRVKRNGEPPLDEEVRVTMFRAMRELLINVARHARTDRAWARIGRQGSHVRVVVEDRGVGFDPQIDQPGYGLLSIRERLRHLDGRLEIESVPGDGTRVTLTAPLSADAQGEDPGL